VFCPTGNATECGKGHVVKVRPSFRRGQYPWILRKRQDMLDWLGKQQGR
jgi:hypothetical protein